MKTPKFFSLPKCRFDEVNDNANKIKQIMNAHSGGTNYLVKVINQREKGREVTKAYVIKKTPFPAPPKVVASIKINSLGEKETVLDEEVEKIMNSAN